VAAGAGGWVGVAAGWQAANSSETSVTITHKVLKKRFRSINLLLRLFNGG
jgi:hypothetical protein